jgi:hypothetical protein
MIFIDRSVPKSVATALMAVRDDVMWLEPRFPHDAKDTDWLPVAGAEGWLVVTRDKRIRQRPGELRSLIEHGVGCFIFTQKPDLTRWEYLKLLCQTLDQMEQLFADVPRPFIYGVTRDGQLRPIYPRPQD